MQRHIALSLGFSVCLLGSACASEGERGLPEASASERRAEQLLTQGEPVAAGALFRAELASRPDAWLAWIGLLRVALVTEDRALADQAVHACLTLLPKSPEAKELLGRTLLELARRETGGVRRQHALIAARLFVDVQRVAPQTPRLRYHVAVAQYLLEDFGATRRLATAELETDPGFEPAWELLVSALESEHRSKDIEQVLAPREAAGTLSPALSAALARARATAPPL